MVRHRAAVGPRSLPFQPEQPNPQTTDSASFLTFLVRLGPICPVGSLSICHEGSAAVTFTFWALPRKLILTRDSEYPAAMPTAHIPRAIRQLTSISPHQLNRRITFLCDPAVLLLGDYLFKAMKASNRSKEEGIGILACTGAVGVFSSSGKDGGDDGKLEVTLNYETGRYVQGELYPR